MTVCVLSALIGANVCVQALVGMYRPCTWISMLLLHSFVRRLDYVITGGSSHCGSDLMGSVRTGSCKYL
jgi:hypothetical protein